MRCLKSCLILTSLLYASWPLAAQEAQLRLLPETPQLGTPIVVYRDGIPEKSSCTWMAFRNGEPLRPKDDYSEKGEWLKISATQPGKYVFVLSCKPTDPKLPESRWATTIELQSKPATSITASRNATTLNRLPLDPPKLSAVEKAIRSEARFFIADFLPETNSLDSNEAARRDLQRALAQALEEVARSAMQQGWDISRIVQETKTHWERAVSQTEGQSSRLASLEWESLERLLKDAGLHFGNRQVEEHPTEAVLVLMALATSLQEESRPLRRQMLRVPQSQPSELTTLTETTISNGQTCGVFPACCRRNR